MSRKDQLPEEESTAVTQAEPAEPDAAPEEALAAPEDAQEPEPAQAPDSAQEPTPATRATASAEDQPQTSPTATHACTMPEESTPSREKGRRPHVRIPHPLWRGWWLAVCVLGIAVLLGRVDAFGVAWVRQPWRAFGGAVATGGLLASLPGVLRHDLPEPPRLRRCLLAGFIGLIWGVLG